jgi:lysyl-tRNA synthetase class 2
MLAKTRDEGGYQVAERFETIINGIELSNGFHELTDPEQQKRRFEQDQARRRQEGLKSYDLDWRLIKALQAGLPPCSGVSIGVDRLLMIITGAEQLTEVMPFHPAL